MPGSEEPLRERNASALKEWASVVEALKSGQQVVLIRKGGLADKGRVFAVEDTEFFFYPTFLHQQVEYVRPDFIGDFEEATRPRVEEGKLLVDSYAVVEESIPVASAEALKRLEGLHIWNDHFIEHRLQWKPESPAWVVLLRVYRLAEPRVLVEQRRYRGCRSWVKLEEELSTSEATPVLSNAQFAKKAADVRAALAG